jgi:integrase
LEDITKEFLNDFEKWMIEKGRSISTVGIYLRTLRTIFNNAIAQGLVRPELYPFGRRKYVIPTGRNMKRALNIEQIKKIFQYPTEPGSSLEKAKDFWMFSYLCNGMNIADITRLRWSNVSPETISFQREKTKRTKRDNPITITVVRNAQINGLIEKWGRPETKPFNEYLFDILDIGDQGEPARLNVQLFSIIVERTLLSQPLSGNMRTKLGRASEGDRYLELSVGEFFDSFRLNLFFELGDRFQYYVDMSKLYICSANTAKGRWIDWWANQTTR